MDILKKNDQIELEITAVSAEGSGIGRHDGMAVFVPGIAVGDKALVHVIKVTKSYAIGKLVRILSPSPYRIKPDCPVSGKCGGCVYRHVTYEHECQMKWQRVRDSLQRIGKLDVTPKPLVPAEDMLRYRNKAMYPVEIKDGQVNFGFFGAHSHRVVPCNDCLLQPVEFQAGLEAFRQWASTSGITSYDETTHTGLLRHAYFRKAFGTGEIMACAVINGTTLPHAGQLANLLQKAVPGLTSVMVNSNRAQTNVILGKESRLLWGNLSITDKLLGRKVSLFPTSFYQVNHQQTENLYTIAKEYAGLTGKEIVLDFYCGVGMIGQTMADQAKEVIGIEIVPQAVANARINATQNNIANVSFLCTDAAAGALELREKQIHPDVVLLDPPRKGCGQELIEVVASMTPERIVYISCDPGTLARDLAIFETLGYQTKEVTPVDLFPRTAHVECVVKLCRE